jgi:hypothetical protein
VTAKPANHIPTSQACTLCHSNPANYKTWTMNHQGITSGCATCHGPSLVFATNVVPKAPPATHIPTNAAACEACHAATNFTSFGGTAMTVAMHNVVSAITCATCHETGKTFFGVTMVTRPTTASHPKTGDCIACHTTTPPFKGDTKPANHIPTTLACNLCHTTSDYSKAVMNHQGITNNCALCHGPNLSFANIVPKAPPGNHIPYTGRACEACHAATNFTTFAGTKMNHTGVTTGCAQCHGAGLTFFGTVPKAPPINHIPYTGVACEACHTPTNYTSWGNTKMNHAPVAAFKCLDCHEFGMKTRWFGVEVVQRKAQNHFAGRDCDESGCHNTTTFSKAVRASAAIPRVDPRPDAKAPAVSSATQGGAGLVQIKPLPLVPGSTGNPHAGILPGACATCHSGRAAAAKPGKHLATALSCDSCHRTTTWVPASYKHAGVAPGQCATCHNNIGAKAKPANHEPTTLACDACHRTTAWTPLLPNAGAPPGSRSQPVKPRAAPATK